MVIQNLIDEIKSQSVLPREKTCDTVKTGDAGADVSHVGVCFMGTAEVIEKAKALGVEFLIVHEPLYYDHWDRDRENQPLVQKKKKVVEESGMTIWRYHDYIHALPEDGIETGVLEKLGWNGHYEGRTFWLMDEARSAEQMAEDVRTKLGCGGVRISGKTDVPLRLVKVAEGDPGVDTRYTDSLFESGFEGVVFAGEVCEWACLEQFRDAAYFGINAAIVVCGHAASEEAGMEAFAAKLQEKHPELKVSFIPTGEVYRHV